MIAAVDTDSPREVFFRVASDMFSDGNFNWGRVVALFYFASKLVLKVGSFRAVSPGRLPSDLGEPGSHEVNPVAAQREWRQLWAGLILYSTNIYWTYYVPGLYSALRTQHQTKLARSLLSWSSCQIMSAKK